MSGIEYALLPVLQTGTTLVPSSVARLSITALHVVIRPAAELLSMSAAVHLGMAMVDEDGRGAAGMVGPSGWVCRLVQKPR